MVPNPPPGAKPDRPPTRRAALRVVGALPLLGALARRPAAASPAPAEPAVLPMGQPHPILTHTARLPVGDCFVTSILRLWALGDLTRCRLCPNCAADRKLGACLVMTDQDLDPGQAALYRLRGVKAPDGTWAIDAEGGAR